MLKWVIVLIAIVIVTGYYRSKRERQEKEISNEEFGSCGSGCAGCANKDLCSGNQNEEKK